MTVTALFFVLLFVGLMLVGAEVFIPGGVLGTLGALALIGAIICSFIAWEAYAPYISIGIIFLVGVAVIAWIKFFPRTPVGKAMTVQTDLSDAEGTEAGIEELLGKEGRTLSDLRPSGFALIDKRRIDVITGGEMVDKDTCVRVVDVESNRVVVEAVTES